MWVSSSNLEKERRDTMKKRTFIIKFFRLIAIILLLLTLLVIAIKIWHSFISDWVSILSIFRGDIHLQNWMFLFFILCKFSCLHTDDIIKTTFWQVAFYYYLKSSSNDQSGGAEEVIYNFLPKAIDIRHNL